MDNDLLTDQDVIWHYTSIDALTAMCESENTNLYATLSSFCNDNEEGKGLECFDSSFRDDISKKLDDTIKKIVKDFDSNEGEKGYSAKNILLSGIIGGIIMGVIGAALAAGATALIAERNKKENNSFKDKIAQMTKNIIDEYDVFVLCFSHQGDSLPQWRSYTYNGGVAIGFSKKELVDKLKNTYKKKYDKNGYVFFTENQTNGTENYWIAIGKCIYKKEDFQKFFTDTIVQNILEKTDFNDSFFHQTGTQLEKIQENFLDISKLFFVCLPFFLKNESFISEDEERILIIQKKERRKETVKFIANKPRIKTGFTNVLDLIQGIIISPHGNKERNRTYAKYFSSVSNKKFSVKDSKSPYNGW